MSSSNEGLVFDPSRTTLPFSAISAADASEDGVFSESGQFDVFSDLLASRTIEQASSDFTLSFGDRQSVSDFSTLFSTVVVSVAGKPSDDNFSNLHEGKLFPFSIVVVSGRLSGTKEAKDLF